MFFCNGGAKRGGRRKRIKIPNMSSTDIGLGVFEFQRILFVFQECSGWDKFFLASCICISSLLLLLLLLPHSVQDCHISNPVANFPFWFVQQWQAMLKHAHLCLSRRIMPNLVGHYFTVPKIDSWSNTISFEEALSVLSSILKIYFTCCSLIGIKLLIS